MQEEYWKAKKDEVATMQKMREWGPPSISI